MEFIEQFYLSNLCFSVKLKDKDTSFIVEKVESITNNNSYSLQKKTEKRMRNGRGDEKGY